MFKTIIDCFRKLFFYVSKRSLSFFYILFNNQVNLLQQVLFLIQDYYYLLKVIFSIHFDIFNFEKKENGSKCTLENILKICKKKRYGQTFTPNLKILKGKYIYFCIKSFSSHVELLLLFFERDFQYPFGYTYFFFFFSKKGNVSKWIPENHVQRIRINYI